MTTFAKSPRIAAFALATMLTVVSCGGSDAASDATDGSSGSSPAATESTPASETGSAVLEVSASLDVVGDALPPLEDPEADAAVGLAAPVITGQQFDGADITIGGETEGPTMLVFLAHWCPHCNDEIPEIVKLRDQGDLPAELNIIGISTAVVEDRENYPPSEWIVDKDWTWPVLADTIDADAFQLYGGSGFPYTVMLNADGTVNARKSGSASAEQIKDWIDAALLV
jgi:cytochrome c biogenesis protein CcmG/thiol:disulfide interchange protein DsbE